MNYLKHDWHLYAPQGYLVFSLIFLFSFFSRFFYAHFLRIICKEKRWPITYHILCIKEPGISYIMRCQVCLHTFNSVAILVCNPQEQKGKAATFKSIKRGSLFWELYRVCERKKDREKSKDHSITNISR